MTSAPVSPLWRFDLDDENDKTLRITVDPSTASVGREDTGTVSRPRVTGKNGTLRIEANEEAQPVAVWGNQDLHDQYKIEGKIGSGGMGVVYLALDRKLNRRVAIKRLTQRARRSESLKRRFLHEAKAVAALSHNNIVHIYALGEDEEGPYIVMEYVEGPAPDGTRNPHLPPPPPLSLEARVKRDGPYSCDDAVEMIIKVARAVAYAHGCGIIHRDLKPANILLDSAEEPKIVDFGLARLSGVDESQLTAPGEQLLSLGYGAPEQESDASATDERADVYGLGALFFFAISGQNPRYYREKIIPEGLREILGRALATERESRWRTVKSFVDALLDYRSTATVALPTVKTTWRCKWCDTLNPVSIRYCGECGWDGGELCAECGAPTHVGIPFCGNCGADAREYETAVSLRARMRKWLAEKRFDQILSSEGRSLAFEPVGPSGRRLVKDLHSIRMEAEKALARRSQLKEIIPLELKAENFERAKTFITEYDSLSPTPGDFSEALKDLPDRLLKRDLERIQKAIRKRDWDYAEKICGEISTKSGEKGKKAVTSRLKQIKNHKRSVHYGRAVKTTFFLLIIYILLPAPLYRWAPGAHDQSLWRLLEPSIRLTQTPWSGTLMRTYNAWWGITNQFELVLSRWDLPEEISGVTASGTARLEQLEKLRANYYNTISQIDVEYNKRKTTWPREYKKALENAMERRREAGDYEGLKALTFERDLFIETGQVSPLTEDNPVELARIKEQFQGTQKSLENTRSRDLVAVSTKYLHELESLRRDYTRKDQLRRADIIDAEMERLDNSKLLINARAALAAASDDDHGDTESPPSAVPNLRADQIVGIAKVMDQYEKGLAAIELEYFDLVDAWPQRVERALEVLVQERIDANDFDGWEEARRELDRFEIERAFAESRTYPPESRLRDLVNEHKDLRKKYDLSRAKSILDRANKTLAKLEEMQTQFMKSGKIDHAALINAEMRRIKSSQEVVAAQELLDAQNKIEQDDEASAARDESADYE